MSVSRLAAFSDGDIGGNPAGVHIADIHPDTADMQSIAADIGYSETAFAEPASQGWRVRYFSPESEVPFCGHATIALGAELGKRDGTGTYSLHLNETAITVESFIENGRYSAALQSPGTRSKAADPAMLAEALKLFGYDSSHLNSDIPPAFANGGANHLVIGLNSRKALSAMDYDLAAGRTFMNKAALVTVMFAYSETAQTFHTRNPFASGGVHEDPATGAATAAFAGYLRDIQWPHNNAIDIIQGEDMGARSLIHAELDDTPGASIRVSGSVRFI
ncbi:MAG: PhzF family phenazine biosynthesis protein [Granulosicoccus sp.]